MDKKLEGENSSAGNCLHVHVHKLLNVRPLVTSKRLTAVFVYRELHGLRSNNKELHTCFARYFVYHKCNFLLRL